MFGIIRFEAAFFCRWKKTLQISSLVAFRCLIFGLQTIPHVADADWLDTQILFDHAIDDIDVGLTSTADAKKRDADLAIGADHPAIAGSSEAGCCADGGGRFQKVAAIGRGI